MFKFGGNFLAVLSERSNPKAPKELRTIFSLLKFLGFKFSSEESETARVMVGPLQLIRQSRGYFAMVLYVLSNCLSERESSGVAK